MSHGTHYENNSSLLGRDGLSGGPIQPSDLTVTLDPAAPPTDAVQTQAVPQVITRGIAEVAAEYDVAVAALEDLYTGSEAYYQAWLVKREAWLRNRASQDRKSELEEASKKVSHLESEMAGACTLMNRRAAAIRSKLLSSTV